ncbi:MAG: acyltransferase family protein, partial [Lachnospiraceae bacterium]|nr:acyltransferase family protein [Lachnospiraceae bacterium]
MPEQRKVYIDVAKGIAILLVILGHMNRFFEYDGRLNQVVYSVQLPVFLLIGGYWLKIREGESPAQFVTKKFYRLLQPYFFFAFASIIYAWPADAAQFGSYAAGALWGIGINNYLPNLPIWFLPMFFVANCWFYLALFIGRFGKNVWQKLGLEAAAAALMVAAGWRIKCTEVRLPWGFELAMILQGMFFAGHLWRLLEEHCLASGPISGRQKRILAALAVPALLIWAVCVKKNGRVDINGAWFGDEGLWSFYLAAFAGCYLLFLASAVIGRCRPLAWLLSLYGKNSMVIMAVHVPVLIWMDGVITPLMPQIIKANFMTKNWIGVSYSFVTISALSLFAAMLLKKQPVHGE